MLAIDQALSTQVFAICLQKIEGGRHKYAVRKVQGEKRTARHLILLKKQARTPSRLSVISSTAPTTGHPALFIFTPTAGTGAQLRVALIAPPLIPVPPKDYGGTELFVAHLATALQESGVDVVVYTNGESTVPTTRRWLYESADWPIKQPEHSWVRDLNHTSWAINDVRATATSFMFSRRMRLRFRALLISLWY
jgi:hypothetical protein